MDLSWILGHAQVNFTHNTNTQELVLKSGEKTTLSDLAKSVTPPCRLNPFLFNGHLQTFFTAVKDAGPPIAYRRKLFESDDKHYAGTFAVDFVTSIQPEKLDDSLPPRTTFYTENEFANIGSDDSRPMLITLHGLSGGSHEIYLRHVLAPLVAETSGYDVSGGWEAIVVNSRGCAMSEITTPLIYNARSTWDVRQIVKWCRKTFPNRPLFAVGYSLGANILTNYLGEEGEKCELKAAAIVSNPWNLEISSLALKRTWIGKSIYSKTMAGNMRALFDRHKDMLCKNPGIDAEAVKKVQLLSEFDQLVQCPVWGYPTAEAYHRDASSCDSLLDIKIPCFLVSAEDDPIAVREAIPWREIEANPHVVMCSTSLGGHLSWFELGGTRWFSKPICGFFQKMAREVDFKETTAVQPIPTVKAGSSSHSPFAFHAMQRRMQFKPVES